MEFDIHKFKHEELLIFSKKERTALFHLAHIHNELQWSQKHLLWVWNQPPTESGPAVDGRVFAFISCLGRFAAQLCETRKAIVANYMHSQLSKKYDSILSEEGRDALKSLNRYFSNKNQITDIRDKISNHFDSEVFSQFVETISPKAEHRFCSTENGKDIFFDFAHSANSACIFALTQKQNFEEALNYIITDVVGSVADWAFSFLREFLFLVLSETSGKRTVVEYGGIPYDNEVFLPFFTQSSRKSEPAAGINSESLRASP